MTALDRLAIQLAMAFGIGKAPKAPGTFGSLPGLALGVGLHHLNSVLLITVALLLLAVLAWWAIARTESVLGIHDDQRIVIDEVAGQAIAVAYLTPSVFAVVLAFGLFRLLDVTKPLLIGKIDRDGPGAFGTLGDDLLAGAVAAAILCPFFA